MEIFRNGSLSPSLSTRLISGIALVVVGAALGLGSTTLYASKYIASIVYSVGVSEAARDSGSWNAQIFPIRQLDEFVLSDNMLLLTLEELAREDVEWQAVGLVDIREQMETKWRSAGIWEIAVIDVDRDRAIQVVDAWQTVLIDEVIAAGELVRQRNFLENQIEALAKNLERLDWQRVELEVLQSEIKDNIQSLKELEPHQLLDSNARARLINLGEDANGIVDMPFSVPIPAAHKPVADYIAWLESMEDFVTQDLVWMLGKVDLLSVEYQELLAAGREEKNGDLNMILSLVPVNQDLVKKDITRERGWGILLGGGLGLLVWFVMQAINTSKSSMEGE